MTQCQHVAPLRRAPAPKCERIFHLACWRCPRAITNELIIAPSQHARTFTRADKHVEWLPRPTRRSSGQLVAFVAVINHPLQMTSRASSAPLRGLAIRYQKRAVLFPRRHGLPTCENCAWGGLGGRQQRARFAHLGLRTASQSKVSRAYTPAHPPRARAHLG